MLTILQLVRCLWIGKCLLSAEDKKKLREMYSDEFINRPHDHHVVRENALSNLDDTHRNYILDSQKIISDAGIGVNDEIRNFTRAANGDGAHIKKAAKHFWEQLSNSTDVQKTMGKLAEAMNNGIFF